MKNIVVPKKSILNLYVYIVSFLIIFSSGAILDQKYPDVAQIIFVALCLPLILNLFLYKRYLPYLLTIPPFYMLINYINYGESILSYTLFILKFIALLAFVRFCISKKINILEKINKIIVAIAVYSLFTYLFLDVLKLLPHTMEVINNKPYKVWFGLHFHGQETDWYSYRVVRNNSIFWEPGVWQMYLNFSLIYQLFIKPKANRFAVTVLLINLVTTFSTTGILTSAIILLIRYIKVKPRSKWTLFLKYYFLVPLIVGGVILGSYILNQKINAGGTRSFNLRMDDLLVGLELFFQKPFFGWGFLNNSGYEAITGTPNNSNGLVSMFFHQGILGILFYFIPLFALMKHIFAKEQLFLGFVITLYVLVSSAAEPIMYANYINLFICLGVVCILDNKTFNEWFNIFANKKFITTIDKNQRAQLNT